MPCPFALLLFVPALQPLFRKCVDGTLFSCIHQWVRAPGIFSMSATVFFLSTVVIVYLGWPLQSFGTPDQMLGPSAAEVEDWLGDIGTEGRGHYTTLALVDFFVYIIAYGVFLVVCVAKLLRRLGFLETSPVQFLLVLPLLAMFFDAFETSGFLWMTMSHPETTSEMCRGLVGYVNLMKWGFVACSVLSVCVLAVLQLKASCSMVSDEHKTE